MKREELAALVTRQTRIAFVVLFIVLGSFALVLTGALEKLPLTLSPAFLVPVLAGLGILLVVAIATPGSLRLPRCPHCSRLLTGWLVHIAIASGNCGYCGKSIED